MSITGVVPPAVVTVLVTLVALAALGLSISLPGGPLVIALTLLALRAGVKGRGVLGRQSAAALLVVAVLALLVQFALLSSYAVTGGGDEGKPISAPIIER